MSLFHHISFKKVDPLGNGLREEIMAEQLEPEAIKLEDGISEGELSQYWQVVEADIERDPEWIKIAEDK